MTPPRTLTFDGTEIPFESGQTVAGALLAQGVRSWRTTRLGHRPRGVFCGIGVCFDCLVTVDGSPNERACLVLAEPGMQISTQVGTGHGG